MARIAEGIYGLVLSTAVVAALSEDPDVSARSLFAAVAVTALVFWLAHVHAHVIAARIVDARGLSVHGLRGAMRRQWPLVLGAVPALVALALGWAGLVSVDTAVSLAIWAGVAALAGCGLVMARRSALSIPATIIATLLSGALGALMVVLKLAIH